MLLTSFSTELIFIDWKCDGRNNFMEFMKIIRITLKESGSSLWSQPIEQYPASRLMQTCGKLPLWPRRCKMRSKTKWEQAKQGKTKDSPYSLGIEGGHKMMRESWTNAPFSCFIDRFLTLTLTLTSNFHRHDYQHYFHHLQLKKHDYCSSCAGVVLKTA